MKSKWTHLCALCSVLTLAYLGMSFSNNPPNGFTGAPPTFNTCASSMGGCHSGGNFNGSISIAGLPGSIMPNTTYNLMVTVMFGSGNPMRGGFQMVALDQNNANAGTLSNPGPSSTISTSGGRTYFEHNPAQFFGGNTSVSYTVDWTAPAGPSGTTITMYAAGNVANGNGSTSGDQIVTTIATGVLMGSPPPSVVITNVQHVSCFGGSDGSITAQASGGAGPPYTYTWSNGMMGATIVNLPAGTYTVTVTDAGGGTATASATVNQPATPVDVSIVQQTNITCVNPTGTATAQATGGTPGYTYTWSNGVTGATNATLPAGPFSVTATDMNGCTDVVMGFIQQNTTPPIADAGPQDTLTCTETLLTLDGSGSSQGPAFTYQWSTSGGHIVQGANTLNPTVDAPGLYSLTVTDQSNGCTASDQTSVAQDITPPTANAGPDTLLNCNKDTLQLDGSASSQGPQFSAQWTTPDGNIVEGADTYTPKVDTVGTYILLVSNDANGCTATDTALVTPDTLLPVADAGMDTTLTCTRPQVQLDGSGSSQDTLLGYQWTTDDGHIVMGDTTLHPLVDAAGTYVLEVFDSLKGCSSFDTVVVAADSMPPNAVAGPDQTLTCSAEQVTLDGSASSPDSVLSYQWTTPDGNIVEGADSAIAIADAPGTYFLTTTDTTNGCQSTDTVVVSENTSPPGADAGPDQNFNCNTTSVTLQGSSPTATAAFSWVGPGGFASNQAQPSVSQEGTYVLTVTDTLNGCTSQDSAVVGSTPPPELSLDGQQDVACHGEATGSATVSGSGGNPPYQFSWSNGATGPTASNLPAGTYSVTLTDADGCTDILTLSISQPEPLMPNATATGESAAGANDGTASATPTGGTPPYTYLWSNGQTTPAITNLAPGLYSLTVTDANGCTAEAMVSVASFDCSGVSLSVEAVDASCFGANDGQLTAQVSGGAAPFQYQWSNGSMDATAVGLPAGTYGVTVTDANNCTVIGSGEVGEPPALEAAVLAQLDALCAGQASGSAEIAASGGTPGYTYTWSDGGTGASRDDLPAGTHSVTVTDANGCTATAEVTIGEPPPITPNFFVEDESALGANNGSVEVHPSGGTPPYTFLWNTGATQDSIGNLAPGEYCVTITDANGCQFEGCATVNSFECAALEADFEVQAVRCAGFSDGAATVSVEGATPPLSYLWSNGSTDATATGLSAGTHSVTVTDALNCSVIATVDVPEPPPLEVQVLAQTDVECPDAATGAAEVTGSGGTPGYTYAWSNGATGPAIGGLSPGTYTVTATDANQCTTTLEVEILQLPDTEPPMTVAQDITVTLDENGFATIFPSMLDAGSTDNCGIDSFFVDHDFFTCDDLGPVTVLLAALDASGNCGLDSATVFVVDDLAPQISCPGDIFSNDCDGPIEYLVEATDNCFVADLDLVEGLPSGSVFPEGETLVTFLAEDASGNQSTCSFTVRVENDLNLNVEFQGPSCFGNDDGLAEALPEGGTPPYAFQWSNGSTEPLNEGLVEGSYSVTVTDANNCTAIDTVVLNAPPPIVIEGEVTNETGNNMDGAIDVTVSGGVFQYDFLWMSSDTLFSMEEDLSGLAAGTYVLTVIDSNGCVAMDTFTVDRTTAVQELPAGYAFELFPNPSSGVVQLRLRAPRALGGALEIYDLRGERVWRQGLPKEQEHRLRLDLHFLPSGLYLLRAVVGEEVLVRKILLQ